jgi:hypothetical protein
MGDGLLTTPITNSVAVLGTISIETPLGTKFLTKRWLGGSSLDPSAFTLAPTIPIPIAAGTVIRFVCTPAAATSTTWVVNFGGYEV